MLNVSFRRFEVFLAIVDHGSFAAAARHLDIAQPSVSAHVQALERQFGGALFLRQRGRVAVLTELGETLRVHARQLLAEAAETEARLGQHRQEANRRVVLACQRSLANFTLGPDLVTFTREHPHFQLSIDIGLQEAVIKAMTDGRADICCYLSNEDTDLFPSEIIGHNRLVCIASPSHPLARRKDLTPAELLQHGFVLPPSDTFFGKSVTGLLREAGVASVRTVANVTEFQLLRKMVMAGVGLSCVLADNVAADLESGTLVALDFRPDNFAVAIRLGLSPSRETTPAVRSLAAFLRTSRRRASP